MCLALVQILACTILLDRIWWFVFSWFLAAAVLYPWTRLPRLILQTSHRHSAAMMFDCWSSRNESRHILGACQNAEVFDARRLILVIRSPMIVSYGFII